MYTDSYICTHSPPTHCSHTHTHTSKYILFTYRDILPKHTMTYTLTTPLIRRRSHIKTHAYQAPHPCRCSGACLASFPLSLHPSLASNPSLRCLPSVDQRCKTLPPAPKLSLQPSIPASLLSNWKRVQQEGPRGGRKHVREREEGGERGCKQASGWKKWEVREEREETLVYSSGDS